MIQKFLTKYWLSFHVVILFIAISVTVFAVERQRVAYIFFLSLLAIEMLFVLPTVFKAESLVEARRRVLRSIEDDAFAYVGLILVGLVCIQWLNSGCTLSYLPDADVWKYSPPPIDWLPYSIESRPALDLLSLVVALFAGVLVIRNGLGKAGKKFILEACTIISGMMAFFCFFESHFGVQPFAGWALQTTVCNLGAFFAFWFFIALGREVDPPDSASSRKHLIVALWWVFAFVGNLVGLLQFSTATGILVYSVVGILLILYRIVHLGLHRVSFLKRSRFVFGIIISLAVVSGAILFFIPASPIPSKVLQIADKAYWSDFIASRQIRTTAALKIWSEAPWTGVGPHGFSHHLGTVIEDADWKLVKDGKRFAWNDALQFLCEWGVIGAGILVAIVIILLIPFFVKTRNLFTHRSKDDQTAGDLFLDLDPYLVPSLVAVITLFAYGWCSSLFQSPVTFLSWFLVLALLPGLLTSQKTR